ncbi:MAG: heme-copper oxidase subunit III [Euryarchaeota archaeon]|jgi:cytochrome c oxidase subunit III|nr:heme-copper oxidase subunit III [Euryarchaeota archaeon]MBT5184079.1 heme-copper oxidase subunit III [Euryarchaeota archaeon]
MGDDSIVQKSAWRANMGVHGDPGEVHSSPVPILFSLGVTLTLAALLAWPFALFGIPLLLVSIKMWITEDVAMWKHREISDEKMGDVSWAMVWIIITEVIVFGGFFAFWFWAKWHTISWDGAISSATWPPSDVHHNMVLVIFNTCLLVSSGIVAHFALHAHDSGRLETSRRHLRITILFGTIFLLVQAYEYANAGFTWSSHPYGTAFYALTGLHGFHVLIGIISLIIVYNLHMKGHYSDGRRDSFQAIVWYWHFVDVVWLLLFSIVYLEVI